MATNRQIKLAHFDATKELVGITIDLLKAEKVKVTPAAVAGNISLIVAAVLNRYKTED